MYGTNYSNYPEILFDSFKNTNSVYDQKSSKKNSNYLLKSYISIFGIPEIGFQLRAKYFLQTLFSFKKLHPKKILDAGSGIGFYSFILSDMFPKSEILGLDMSEDKLNFCKNYMKNMKNKNLKFEKADLIKYSSGKNKYDLIINIDVLEHIKDYKKVLSNFYSMLKPKGILYIHTPKSNQKRIFKGFFKDWEHEEHEREGFDPRQFKLDLEKIGFKKVNFKIGFSFWGKLAWELNHVTLSKSFILAGLLYPMEYLLLSLDKPTQDNDGLTIIVTAQK